jgi:hypothetical protein
MAEGKSLGIGKKRIIMLLVGAVGVFLGSVPLHLYVFGVLSSSSPYLRPAPGFAAADSLFDTGGVETDDLGDQVGDGTPAWSASTETDRVSKAEPVPPMAEDALDPTVEPPAERESENRAGGTDLSGASEAVDRPNPERVAADSSSAPNDSLGPAAASSDSLGPAEHPAGAPAEAPVDALLPFDEAKLSRLVKVYEKMRPKQVALILGTMADRQALLILTHMKDKDAAEVLAELEPGKAARISQILVNWSGNEQ